MKVVFSRMFGVILIAVAILGMVFSVIGVVGIWRVKDSVTESAATNLDLVIAALDTTADGLDVAGQSLDSSIENVIALTATISATARTVEASAPLVDTFVDLVQNDLPETVEATQLSLASAQEAAKVIDTVLTTLNRIPLIGRIYTPPAVSLPEALGQVSTSFDQMPETFSTMETSLEATRSNLDVIESDIQLMAVSIGTISASLEDAQAVIGQYEDQIATLQRQVRLLDERLPEWIDMLAWVFTFIFAWLGLTQIGLLAQGIEMLGYSPPPAE